MRGRTLAGFALLVACLLLPSPAEAAFPGKNGKIAFTAINSSPTYPTPDIYSVNPDGTGLFQIIDEDEGTWEDSYYDEAPEWSPNATRVAFTSTYLEGSNEPWLLSVNGDGTDRRVDCGGCYSLGPSWSPDGSEVLLTSLEIDRESQSEAAWLYRMQPGAASSHVIHFTGGAPVTGSAWSPNGSKVVFVAWDLCAGCGQELYTASPVDGSGLVRLTNTPDRNEQEPDWSPDGQRVVYSANPGANTDIYTMKADGTDVQRLTTNPALDSFPSWSPDGTKIAFESRRSGASRIYTMNTDGSGLTDVIAGSDPDWQSIPINSYPRPKGATPFRTSLVPAYKPCTSTNRTHGPPLAYGSCNPPAMASDELTLGTPEVNAKPARGGGLVEYGTLAGNPATPADEADVRITFELQDVYDQQTAADYSGELRLRTGMRITDKLNTPHPGGPGAATVSDATLGATVSCVPTADANQGATCNLLTSADAIAPGTVTEGKRAVWSLGQVQVDDGGADGNADTPGDNTLFMAQGVFVP